MLVFTRRRDEAIMIGDGIEVKVLRVGKDVVRIGIDAPAEVAVHRGEIYEQIRAENRAAAQATRQVAALADRVREVTRSSSLDPHDLSKRRSKL
ncbi:MAG: carbon storage regulator CsrA [Vicinamibacterales bacterium]